MIAFLKRWGTFVKERFEPVSRSLMILTFVGANAYFAHAVSGASFAAWDIAWSVVVCGLIFFHLRLFDEWKDYDVDCEVNPRRPLPRGLIDLGEYRVVTGVVIVLEVVAAALIGPVAAVAVLVPVGYSLVMLKEFFVGDWLRPKLELYAVTHTLVAAWIALFLYSALTGVWFWEIPPAFLAVMAMAWMLFNIFEFARKTFAEDEERSNVESYSRRLTPVGASALVWGCSAVILGLLFLLVRQGAVGVGLFGVALGLSALIWLTSLGYLLRNTERLGAVYRGVHSVYLMAFNAVFAVYGLAAYFGI